MNKTELIDKIAAGAEITKAQAKAALEATTKDYFNYKYRAVLYGCPIFFYSIQVYSNLNLHV